MSKKVVVQFNNGRFYSSAVYEMSRSLKNDCADPSNASDVSGYERERDIRSALFIGDEPFKLIEYEVRFVPTGNTVILSDMEIDPLKAIMMGRAFGLAHDLENGKGVECNPFEPHNPSHKQWTKGFYAGISAQLEDGDCYWCDILDQPIYPVEG